MEDELFKPLASVSTPRLTTAINTFLNYDCAQVKSSSTRNRFYAAVPKIFEQTFVSKVY